MMHTSQIPVMNSVNRSRFFSTTVDPDRLDCTPPPNSVDRPPPFGAVQQNQQHHQDAGDDQGDLQA